MQQYVSMCFVVKQNSLVAHAAMIFLYKTLIF